MNEISEATQTDALEIVRLLTSLGHDTSVDEINERWDKWVSDGNLAFVFRKNEENLAGLITLHKMFVLHRPHYVGRITALIVDEKFRGQGIGRALVETAEVYLKSAGCGLLEITSNKRLKKAHLFYEQLGYERTSERFGKTILNSTESTQR